MINRKRTILDGFFQPQLLYITGISDCTATAGPL